MGSEQKSPTATPDENSARTSLANSDANLNSAVSTCCDEPAAKTVAGVATSQCREDAESDTDSEPDGNVTVRRKGDNREAARVAADLELLTRVASASSKA